MNEDIKQLIKGAQLGNRDALEAIAARFQKMILINCSLRLDDSSLAEDAAQEVTEQLLSGIGALKSPEAFTSWLDQIILRTCIRANRLNRSRKSREVELDTSNQGGYVMNLIEEDVSQDPEASFAMNQAREDLLARIQLLPQAQRAPLILYYFGAMSYRQIGDLLHIKVGTVSSNISKGKKNLNKQLLEEL